MTGRADFLVDLEAALRGSAIEGAERALEMPVPVRRMLGAAGRDGHGADGEGRQRDGAGDQEIAGERLAHGS